MPRRMMCRLSVVLGAAAILAAGCSQAAAPSPTPGATPQPDPVSGEKGVPFESENSLNAPGKLDVYWPVEAGPWPVVVMFHGGGMNSGNVEPFARHAAALGFVVFGPNWGRSGGDAYDALTVLEQTEADLAQAACAVAFASTRAADYGGDPARLILFGHSAGGNIASVLTFSPHEPTSGCLGDAADVPPVEAFVAFEGDWLLANPMWDAWLADEPELFPAWTSWDHFADQPELAVHLLASSAPGEGRTDGDWIEVRDPSGSFRSTLEGIGALDDNYVGLDEMQAMLFASLETMGHPTTFEVMPDSTHIMLSDAGWEVFESVFADLQD